MRPAIVVLDQQSLGPSLSFRAPAFEHEWIAYDATRQDEIDARIDGARIVITNKVPLDGALIARHPTLQLIAVAATGYDVIDVAAATANDVDVVNVRRYAEDSVPEHCFALILALVRQLPAYRRSLPTGAWQRSGEFCYFEGPMQSLAGKTLGLIGYGSIARRVATIARAFELQVIVNTRSPDADSTDVEFVALDTLYRRADVVSLHCPLTAATRGLIDAAALSQMRTGAILINTARGPLLDDRAVVKALDSGQLGGLGVDVLSVEPPPDDHPLLALAERDNVIVTPHIAWGALEARQRLADQVIDLIDAWAAGRPRHLLGRSA
ncbi:MAG: D-2-hydroxyacid dehydrogenase [Pseudomonadota bacterium]